METKTCEICKGKDSVYTCPRCDILYCSVKCYQDHKLGCTEEFYRENIVDELKSTKVTDEERKKFEKLLFRLHNFDLNDENDNREVSNDSDEGNTSEDSLSDTEHEKRCAYLTLLAENDQLKESDLTEREKKLFKSHIQKGLLNEYLPGWKPFWITCGLEKDAEMKEEPVHICCSKSRKASPEVSLLCAQTIYGYAHCIRTFNGDIFEEPSSTLIYIMTIAKNLWKRSRPNFENFLECLQYVKNPPVSSRSENFDVFCLSDVVKIMSFKDFALICINDILKLIEANKNFFRDNNSEIHVKSKEKEKRLLYSEKKLLFLKSFCNFHFDDIISCNEVIEQIYLNRLKFINEKENQLKNEDEDIKIRCPSNESINEKMGFIDVKSSDNEFIKDFKIEN